MEERTLRAYTGELAALLQWDDSILLRFEGKVKSFSSYHRRCIPVKGNNDSDRLGDPNHGIHEEQQTLSAPDHFKIPKPAIPDSQSKCCQKLPREGFATLDGTKSKGPVQFAGRVAGDD